MDFIAAQSRKPPVSRRGIYWLASYPRSGNTWLRTFVGNLLGIKLGEPIPENTLANGAKYTAVERMVQHYQPFINLQDAIEHPLRAMEVRPRAQQELANQNPHSIFVKTHSAAAFAGGVPQINVSVTRGATYVIRNPLDVACSLAPFFGISIDEAIQQMSMQKHFLKPTETDVAEFVSSWSINVESWTKTSTIEPFVLRYEDMLNEPQRAFAAFTRHSKISATVDQIDRAIESASFGQMQRGEAARDRPQGVPQTWKFFRVGKSNQWRHTLTPPQIDRIVADHGKWMERYGYLPEQAD